eukprot:m51a1_g414 hypothetical protein (149) ;mRNA; f:769836-770568
MVHDIGGKGDAAWAYQDVSCRGTATGHVSLGTLLSYHVLGALYKASSREQARQLLVASRRAIRIEGDNRLLLAADFCVQRLALPQGFWDDVYDAEKMQRTCEDDCLYDVAVRVQRHLEGRGLVDRHNHACGLCYAVARHHLEHAFFEM